MCGPCPLWLLPIQAALDQAKGPPDAVDPPAQDLAGLRADEVGVGLDMRVDGHGQHLQLVIELMTIELGARARRP